MNTHAIVICLIIVVPLLLPACATPPITSATATGNRNTSSRQTGETIWVLDSGWHTGLVLKRSELGTSLTALLHPGVHMNYLMFGWGNRRFYMTPEPTLGMDISALFPSRSTMLVEGCKVAPRICYSSTIKLRTIRVSAIQQARLDQYLLRSFQADKAGQADLLGPGPDPGSEFYASGLSYDAFHTCNTWTAAALQMAGVSLSDPHVIFASQLWRQLP